MLPSRLWNKSSLQQPGCAERRGCRTEDTFIRLPHLCHGLLARTLKWLEDIRASAALILRAVEGKTLDHYRSDDILRAAVERHFEIMGEAVGRIARHDPDTATRIGDYPRIIAFRNILIHGYDLVDDASVWSVVQQNLPLLLARVEVLLADYGDEGK